MKIVFIGPFGLQPKGTMSVRALPLAKALVRRGHRVTILIPPWDDPGRAGQSWPDEGVQITNMPLPPGVPLLFHLRLTHSLVTTALALQPEVIHFFKPKAYAGLAHLAVWLLARLKRSVRRLVVDSDDWEQAWNDRLPYSRSHKQFFAWQEQWGLRHADAITVASRALNELVTATIRGGQPPVFYLPNGWPAPTNRPSHPTQAAALRRRWRLPEGATILLYSRFLEFRLERIVALVKFVATRLPQARWLMVGRGLNGEEKRLAELLQGASLEGYVHFAGWVVPEELPAYFQVADVAIYPYDDTLINRTKCSVKLIELLAAGLPVVADAVGQNCEYIQSGRSGLLTPPEDDAALGEAVGTLLESPTLRQKLGQGAAQAVAENYNWLHLSQIVERAYNC